MGGAGGARFRTSEDFPVYFPPSPARRHGGAGIKTVVALALGLHPPSASIRVGSVRLTMGVDDLVKGVSFVVRYGLSGSANS